jgi:hypothetical protein
MIAAIMIATAIAMIASQRTRGIFEGRFWGGRFGRGRLIGISISLPRLGAEFSLGG